MTTTIRGFEVFNEPQPNAATLFNQFLLWSSASLGGGFKVIDRDLTAPPGSPVFNQVYLIAASPTGAWNGKAGQLTQWDGAQWIFLVPVEGDQARILDENLNLYYDGAAWQNI